MLGSFRGRSAEPSVYVCVCVCVRACVRGVHVVSEDLRDSVGASLMESCGFVCNKS